MRKFENLPKLNKDEILQVIEGFLKKKSMSLKNMKDEEVLIVLSLASLCISEKVTTEPEVNLALIGWLNNQGSMLRVDHIELRRTLIDLNFWHRDPLKALYHRTTLEPYHLAFSYLQTILTIDIHRYIENFKFSEDQRRIENMKKFANQSK